MTTPVPVVAESTSSKAEALEPVSGNSRRPEPNTSGWIRRTNPSTRSRHKRPDQHPAAEHHQVLAQLPLEPGHGIRGVAFEECGVLPRQRLGQRCRRHVLLDTVERLGERVRFLLGPVVREALIRRPAGQEGPALDMCAPMTSCMAGSWRWFAQPPCSKPSRGPRRRAPVPASRRRASGARWR